MGFGGLLLGLGLGAGGHDRLLKFQCHSGAPRSGEPGTHGCAMAVGRSRGFRVRPVGPPRNDSAPQASMSNFTPCASGRVVPKLIVLVARRMYAFQASDPLSRPPPVSFSPPNAPPISAPDGPILTLAMPQSDPAAERKRSASFKSFVKIDEDRPWTTILLSASASSSCA